MTAAPPTVAAATADPFPRRLTAWIAGVAGVCLLGSMVALMLPGREDRSVGADSTSRSAIGHRALVDLLRAEGIPVVVSRTSTGHRTASASLLLVLEPLAEESGTGAEHLAALIRESRCPVLVALPKWFPKESGTPRRLVSVSRFSPPEVNAILTGADPAATCVEPGPEAGPGPRVTANAFQQAPEIDDPQLVHTGSDWTPLIGTGRGNLLAEKGSGAGRVALLADPDLVANHGLHRGQNARLALDLVARLREGGGPVLVDETLHGLAIPGSFWAELFTFPLALVTVQAVLAAALLLWAGVRRFGAAEPAPLPFEPGKRFLIEHTARLLDSGRHHGEAVSRYAALVAEDAARRLHAESAAAASDAAGFLAKIEARQGLTPTLSSLESEANENMVRRPQDPRAALRLAVRLRRWKQEIVDGSDVRARAR